MSEDLGDFIIQQEQLDGRCRASGKIEFSIRYDVSCRVIMFVISACDGFLSSASINGIDAFLNRTQVRPQ